MATFNEMMQQFVNLPYESLIELAKQALPQVSNAIKKLPIQQDENASTLVLSAVFFTCVGADGTLSALELQFINDLLGTDYSAENIASLTAALNTPESVEMLDSLADVLDQDDRAALVALCLCFLSVDETISREEVAFVKKLLD